MPPFNPESGMAWMVRFYTREDIETCPKGKVTAKKFFVSRSRAEKHVWDKVIGKIYKVIANYPDKVKNFENFDKYFCYSEWHVCNYLKKEYKYNYELLKELHAHFLRGDYCDYWFDWCLDEYHCVQKDR